MIKFLIYLSLVFVIQDLFFIQNTLAEEKFLLPKLPQHNINALSSIKSIQVKQFQFTGNQVVSDEQLQSLVKSYINQNLTIEQVLLIKDKISRYYIDQGYINSGAVLPDQKVVSGIITYHIIEGSLTETKIETTAKLHPDYVSNKLTHYYQQQDKVLNIFSLQKSLKLLEQDPLIESIEARLEPGLKAGESLLDLKVNEVKPYQSGLIVNNYRSPSIGSQKANLFVQHANLFGFAESLYMDIGLLDNEGDYTVFLQYPLMDNRTRLSLGYEKSSALVIEEPFNSLDFESQLQRLNLAIQYRVKYELNREMNMALAFNHSENKTTMRSQPFISEHEEGVPKVNELSLRFNWIEREQQQVIALESVIAAGLDVFDASISEDGALDGEYLRFTTQLQWLRTLPFLSAESLFKVYLQISDDNLLSLNQFALGGAKTVRGYRENTLVRDNALLLSWQLNIPLSALIDSTDQQQFNHITLQPFIDFGYAKNKADLYYKSENIYSMGIGINWKLSKTVELQFDWAKALHDLNTVDGSNLQDKGFHLQFKWLLF